MAEESYREERIQLRRLYEACRTRDLQTGTFPSGFFGLDELLRTPFPESFSQAIEFKDPGTSDNKLRRRSPMGERTPCLRLKLSGGKRWLNVAQTGWIFESGEYWESEFVHLMPRPFMAPNLLKKDFRPIPARAALRSPRCGPRQLDLASRCNALPTVPWIEGPNLESAPPSFGAWIHTGMHEIRGILFDVRGVIQVDGLVVPAGQGVRNIPAYPRQIHAIPVEQPIGQLHLLAGTVDPAPKHAIVAVLKLHYQSGEEEELPLRYGEHFSSAADPNPAPERLPGAEGAAPDFYALHYLKLTPARPGEKVVSMDFISGGTTSHPYLLAATVEP